MNRKKTIKKFLLILFYAVLVCSLIFFVSQKMVKSHYSSSDEYQLIRDTDSVVSNIVSLQNSDQAAQSNFLIFQTNKGEIIDSVFYKENNLFDTTYQIYVECQYNDKDFDNELNRIKDLSCRENGITQNILYSKTGFLYEAYISVFEENIHEYALVDKENSRVYYVYEQFSDIKNGNIPEDLLWKDFKLNKKNTEKGYNMYFYE